MKNAWRWRGWSGILIVVLTIAAYWPALRGRFIWDDDFYVTRNQALRSLEGLGRIWTQPGMGSQQYYPLSFTGLWVQYHLWNRQPFGYHLVNILFHSVNALLLWSVLRRLEAPGAWWAAAIFALHPVQVESVAWITEFKNVSSGTFSLLALLAFLRCRSLSSSGTSAPWDRRFHALALLLFVCALLCKTAVCCLPVAIAVLLWWKQDRATKRDVLALIPWFAVSLMFGLITVRVESQLPETGPTDWAVSIVRRGWLASRALWFYAGKVFWPHPLTFVYPRWDIEMVTTGQYLLYPSAGLAVLVGLWLLRRQMGKGPLAAVMCFVAMLLPVLGFFNIFFFRYSLVTDHFQYLASIGLMALAVSAGTKVAHRMGQRGRDLGTLAAGVVLLVLGVCTWRQTHVYQDLETLWRDTLAKNPNAWIAHNNLGHVLLTSGKTQEAVEHWEQAVRLKPDYAEARDSLGAALAQAGKIPEAIEQFDLVLRTTPNDAEAHYNLGVVLVRLGRVPEAIEHYEHALRIRPDFAEAHNELGAELARAGHLGDAIGHYEQALRIDPDYARAHNNLGNALVQAGRLGEGIGHYEQALRIDPDYARAHNNLGNALVKDGRIQDAIGQYEQALRLKPDFAEAHYNLGVALEQSGKMEQAMGQYEQALRLKPDFTEAHDRLARLQSVR